MSERTTCPTCFSEIPSDAPDGACPRCRLAAGLGSEPRAPNAADPPGAEEVEAKLQGFEILSVLGHGGMGVVYKARQKALDRIVALKVLPPAVAASPGFAERFAREAKALARLTHPSIVAVHDFGETAGLCWLVMEYVDGMNVREAMRAGRIGPKEALAIVPQICDALQYAHDRGVVHRDVKPENILVGRDGRVRVADFGLAKIIGRETGAVSLTGAQQVMGTLHYMAPEQWQRPKEVDHRADIYSLGVVFYEMLTGDLPLGRFEPPSHKAQIDVRVDEVVLRSLERDRERRWQHASDVKTKVTEMAGAAPSVPPPIPPSAPPPLAARAQVDKGKRPIPFEAAVLALLAVGFAIAALATDASGWWWATGAAVLGAAVAAVHERTKQRDAAAAVASGKDDDEPKTPAECFTHAAYAAFFAAAWAIAAAVADAPGLWWVAGPIAFGAVVLVVQGISMRESPQPDAAAPERLPVAILALVAVGFAVIAGAAVWAVRRAAADDASATWERAPWDFEVPGAYGTADAIQGGKQAIWKRWSILQAVHGAVSDERMDDMYLASDWDSVQLMSPADRTAAGAAGKLGLPLLPRDRLGAELSAFRITSARLEGFPSPFDVKHFSRALVEATDGKRTLTVAMVFGMAQGRPLPDWRFAAAAIEIK